MSQALVSVYRKLLEFYRAAFEMLTSRGTRLIVKLTLEEDQLPGIVQDFLRHADYLRRLVQKATWEIVEDIKAMLYDAEIARWLGGGKMEMQSRYHALLQEIRADRACDFLLENPQLADWYHASQSRQLALLGDTGCGKTVAVSFLVDELGRRNEHRLPRPKVCYFYCRDDETGQAVQVVSGLILSLLEQLPGLKKDFFGWYKQAQASGILEPATSIKKLGEFLHKILEAIDRPVFILIDGLDECDGVSRRTILVLLKTLSQKITQLKTVLASRPQEDILAQLAGVGNIYLGSNLERDEIIVKAAVERQLFHLPEDSKALIVHRLSRMAQGNAIWTKMTVELIEIRGIRALGPMRRFLEEMPLPRQLSRLYGRLFSRYTSGELENEGLASAGLKLLAVARRPLSMLELAWAIALATARREVTTVTALADLVDHQRVLGLMHPFISRVDYSDTGKRQVQLIHQSVKEFILDDLAQTQAPTVPAETGQLLCDRPAEMLEAMATDICIRYLLLHDVDAINLFSEEQMAIAELPQEAGLFDDDDGDDDEAPTEYDPRCTWEVWEGNMIRYDPAERGLGEFFVYASCHWLEHLAAVTSGSLLSLPSIEDVCQPGSTRLRNWTQQNCRPSCAVQPRFEFDGSLYDPLGIVSLYGSEAMLRYMLKVSEFGGDRYLPRSAFRAADQILQWGDLARLRILSLDGRVGGQLRNLDFFRLAIHQWFITDERDRNWDLAFDLVDLSFDDMIRERWGNELLCIAAGAGCMPLVQRLMAGARRKAELRNELLCGSRHESLSSQRSKHQSIGEAVLGDHVDVVEYLLGEDGIAAHLEFRNARGENVLHLASRLCNPRMVRVLAPRSTGFMHDADDRGDTALERIVKSTRDPEDRYESARIILLHTPTIWKSRPSGQHARLLQLAVQLGDLDMCRVLLCVGKLNPLLAMTRGDDGQPSLKGEAHQDEGTALEILRLLRLGTSSDNTA
ncbi:NACHT domain [Geosmithia morbida]|uniref:NACHT domain n=1 Tax=Geosmithia morbida TaxID=1094350 RepID=A0A9P5D631_9HYPO|nr:NACHT domain [Geosmithia morbida]KAF4124385.1 NACHT domain [Geosmithia morbida]